MADIELVIKIPEEDYGNCMKYDALTSSIYKAIQKGTLLPKGHGKLIDANILITRLSELGYITDDIENDTNILEDIINDGLAIIEADNESEG